MTAADPIGSGVVSPVWVRGIERATAVAAGAAAVCTVLMALHVIADVIGRSVANRPLPATLELVGYGWMPLIVFLALAEAQRSGEHLRVTLFVERLAPAGRRVGDVLALGVGGVVLALTLLYATGSAIGSVEVLEVKPAVFEVPIWPFRLVAVLGLLLLVLQTAASLWRAVRGEPIRDAAEAELAALGEQEETTGAHRD